MPPTTRSKIKEIKQSPRKAIKKQKSPRKGGNNQELEKQKLQKQKLEKQELGKLIQKGESRKHVVQKQESQKKIPESQESQIPEPERKRSKRIELRKTELQKNQLLLKQQAGTHKTQRQVLQKQETEKDQLQKPMLQISRSQKELSEKHKSKRNQSPRIVLSQLELHTTVQNTELKSQSIALQKQRNRKEQVPKLRLQKNGIPRKQKSLKWAEQKQNSSKLDSTDKENLNLDIYEFTFDPNDEPPPPKKKKRNRVVKKKPTKQKPVIFKNFYESNISKALNHLKNIVKKTAPSQNIVDECKTVQVNPAPISNLNIAQTPISIDKENKNTTINDSLKQTPKNIVPIVKVVQQNITQNAPNKLNFVNSTPIQPTHKQDAAKETLPKSTNVSIRVEDIAADFDAIMDDDIDYSPINSPIHIENPINVSSTCAHTPERSEMQSRDPLNLQGDISFFNNPPVANSSMIKSTKAHLASPWRVEFQNLPIKWNINSYVKADMTPAIESSFVNFEDNKKKHVYTNLVPQTDEVLPQLIQNSTPQLKQTSIISFIKEVIEKSAKKKRGKSVSPTKVNSVFDETYNTVNNNYENTAHKTPNKALTPRREVLHDLETPNKDSSEECTPQSTEIEFNENSRLSRKHKTITKFNTITKNTQKEKDDTYFGFNDSESQEQENVYPIKNVNAEKVRALKPRSRAVLKEMNAETGPMRAVLPVAVKSKFAPSSEAVNKLYEEMKSAAKAPMFPEKEGAMHNVETTNVDNYSSQQDINDDDSQSVHLFEDIELIHHLKPHRKSYGKPKRVAFQRQINFDSDTEDSDIVVQHPELEELSDEDNLEDLTFKVPKERSKRVIKKKKQTKKQKLTKKEEQEADAWAAGFNSMCEDVDQFTLVVE